MEDKIKKAIDYIDGVLENYEKYLKKYKDLCTYPEISFISEAKEDFNEIKKILEEE